MYDGDGYEDQLLGDPNQLDDLIQARDLNPNEDEQHGDEENEADEQDQEKGDDSSKNKTKRKVVLNPQPKLDALRLNGPRGLSAVEGLFQDFKFLGRGYEEQDLKRIMERLELWGNRLYPKFQFDDLLEKVEKLGQKRSVMNYLARIRMGLDNDNLVGEGPRDDVDDAEMDLDADPAKETERNAIASDDLFTQLIEQQLSQVESQQQQSSAPTTQAMITEDQRQRMLENRRLAEERRLARLKAQQEKSSLSITSESSKVVTPSEQSDTSKPTETVDEGCPAYPSDMVQQNSVIESADENVDINDAVVSTIEERCSEGMEISPAQVEERE